MSKKNKNTPEPKITKKTSSTSKRFFGGFVREIVIPIIMAIIVIQFVIQAFKIPSGSMEDSLLVGDFLLGLKFSYGSPKPFSDDKLPGFSDPDTGDVIIFRYPGEPEYPDYDNKRYTHLANLLMFGNIYWDNEAPEGIPSLVHYADGPKDFIKRCVAKSGQTISISKGELYLNGEKQPLPGHGKLTSVARSNNIRDELKPLKIPEVGNIITLDSTDILNLYRYKQLILQENPESKVEFDMDIKVNGEIMMDYTFPHFNFGQVTQAASFMNFKFFTKTGFIPVPYKPGKFSRRVGYQFYPLHEVNMLIQNVNLENIRDTANTIELVAHILVDGKAINQYKVKDNVYFMMGDNRDNSSDGRYWGFLSKRNIKAKAFIIYYSFDNLDGKFKFLNPFTWLYIPFKIRWTRIARLIHWI